MRLRYLSSMLGMSATLSIVLVVSCARKSGPPERPAPRYFDADLLAAAGERIGEGYDLLGKDDLEGAVARFAEVDTLIPTGLWAEYHTACAYGRSGDGAESLRWIEKAVANGFDQADRLEGDPDLESTRKEAGFADLLRRARENNRSATASLARGLPEPGEIGEAFADEEAIDAWSRQEYGRIRENRPFWTAADYLLARADLAARGLAARKALHAGDPDFDYGLERIRAAFHLKSVYESGWGSAAEAVRSEADDYLKGDPPASGADEARFLAASALSLKQDAGDPSRADGFHKAEPYLSRIASGSDHDVAARTLTLINAVQTPGADEAALAPRLREVLREAVEDETANNVVSTRLGQGAVRFVWPLPIDVPDLDGSMVTLDEYRGKALLVDFWATWCPPCRAELPGLAAAYETYHPRGLEVLSISLDRLDDTPVEDFRVWIDEHGMTWRHVYDGAGWESDLAGRFFVGSIPSPFLIGRDGDLAAWGEACRGEKLAASIEKALGT